MEDGSGEAPFQMRCDLLATRTPSLYVDVPENDANYSVRWAAKKALFSKYYMQAKGIAARPGKEKAKRLFGSGRYWEHCIRDEQDYIRHPDYIHYNPVKHNLVKNVSEWKWSSFHKYKAKGYYQEGWGENDAEVLSIEGEFGE